MGPPPGVLECCFRNWCGPEKKIRKGAIRNASSMVKHLTPDVYIVTVAQVVCWVSGRLPGKRAVERMKRVNHPSITLKEFSSSTTITLLL